MIAGVRPTGWDDTSFPLGTVQSHQVGIYETTAQPPQYVLLKLTIPGACFSTRQWHMFGLENNQMIAKIYLTNGSYTTVNENFMFSLVMCIDVEEFDVEWLEPDGDSSRLERDGQHFDYPSGCF